MPKPAIPLPGHPPRVYYTNKEGKMVSRPLYNHHLGPVSEEDMGEERLEERPDAAQRSTKKRILKMRYGEVRN